MGRTSRLKSMVCGTGGSARSTSQNKAASSAAPSPRTINHGKHRWTIVVPRFPMRGDGSYLSGNRLAGIDLRRFITTSSRQPCKHVLGGEGGEIGPAFLVRTVYG